MIVVNTGLMNARSVPSAAPPTPAHEPADPRQPGDAPITTATSGGSG